MDRGKLKSEPPDFLRHLNTYNIFLTALDIPPMMERQRSLPRSVRHHIRSVQQLQQQPPQPPSYLQPPPPPSSHQQQQQLQPQLHHGSRTSSMGRLDPSRPMASGSQPCLLVAQTVSNRRKRHGGQQHHDQKSTVASTTHSRPVTASLSKKKSFQRSESFHQPKQQQAHFFVNTQLDQVCKKYIYLDFFSESSS